MKAFNELNNKTTLDTAKRYIEVAAYLTDLFGTDVVSLATDEDNVCTVYVRGFEKTGQNVALVDYEVSIIVEPRLIARKWMLA